MDYRGPGFKQQESNLYPATSTSAPQQPPGYNNYQQQHQPQQQQYVPSAGSNVVIVNTQPQASSTTKGQPQNVRDWSTGMCECFDDIGGCLYCTFCFACFTCTLANKMDECCMGPICCPGFLLAMRSKLRGQYGIRGSICNDVCCMMWCTQCLAHQMYRELDKARYI